MTRWAVATPTEEFEGEATRHGKKTYLVNALESHWYNDMLRAVVENKVKEGDQPKSHEIDINECNEFLNRGQAGRSIVSNWIVQRWDEKIVLRDTSVEQRRETDGGEG